MRDLGVKIFCQDRCLSRCCYQFIYAQKTLVRL